ncbi:MAG: hypothetical protein FJX62_05860 [Alphaproteobacteria bacterium]|nr:hypothetical protein [Alphaproteobacteria bacterium]
MARIESARPNRAPGHIRNRFAAALAVLAAATLLSFASASASEPPPLTCIGGQSTGSTCICPANTKQVQTGAFHFVCTMDRYRATPWQVDNDPPSRVSAKRNPQPGSVPYPQHVTCIGGKADFNVCLCSAGTKAVQTSPGRFVCTMDRLTAGQPPADAPSSGVPLPPRGETTPSSQPPRLVCIGGKSTGTACFCPAGTAKVQTGPNRFVCTQNSVTNGGQRPNQRGPLARTTDLLGPGAGTLPGRGPSALGTASVPSRSTR